MAHTEELSPEELEKAENKNILRVTLILSIITLFEFAFALLWPDEISRTILNISFLVMTIAKAFFIVSEFMHLGHEAKSLIQSILIPLVFLVWLIIALMIEGSSIMEARFGQSESLFSSISPLLFA